MSEQEREKLKVLLGHWIEHNKEHGEEFREWAEKAGNFNKQAVCDNIKMAANQLDEASPILEDGARLTIEGDKLRLTNLFGEEKEVHGKVKEIDFQNSRVVLG